MKVRYIPLLSVQRGLQNLPRNSARFQKYLRTMMNGAGTEPDLAPLLLTNPMAKEHVTALLDDLLALDADGIAARTAIEVSAVLADEPSEFDAAVVVVDDLMGGWTNRYAVEHALRFDTTDLSRRSGRHRVFGALWSSETASMTALRESIAAAMYRMVYIRRHGSARTLREKLAQEGWVQVGAGCTLPILDAEELDYTREVLAPHLELDDMRTAIECLFGDAAAATLGFTPRGLSQWAGLSMALDAAQTPNKALQQTGAARSLPGGSLSL